MPPTLAEDLMSARSQAILAQEMGLLLASRNSIRWHPTVSGGYAGPVDKSGSASVQLPLVGWLGYDLLSAVAEGAAVPNTALTMLDVTATAARQAKSYTGSDLVAITEKYPLFSAPVAFAADAMQSMEGTFIRELGGLATGYSQSCGSTGQPFSVTYFMAGKALLATANAKGPYLSVMHPKAYDSDLQTSIRAETGPLAFQSATADQLRIRGDAYKGNFLGVDLFVDSICPTQNSGTDRAGLMIGQSAIAWCDANIAPDPTRGPVIHAGPKLMIAFKYDPVTGLKVVVINWYFGITEGQDAAGVNIISAA